MAELQLPYGEQTLSVKIPDGNLWAVLTPRSVPTVRDAHREIARALDEPIGMAALEESARGASNVVLVADDLTRQTPVDRIIPLLLDRLNAGGVPDGGISVLIALGTHRPMTDDEMLGRFGAEVVDRVAVRNSPWRDADQLVDLGVTPNGTPVLVSRQAVDADYVVGIGSIVPHHICGYSGGAKIIQPGISGAATTAATHAFSTRTRRSYLGMVENPVRAEMEEIAEQVGLRAIFNTVLDAQGRLVRAFFGEPRATFREGVSLSREVFGVPAPGQADIVVAGSHPCDIEFWQAHKSLYPADILVREGGTVIVVTPCPEGVSVSHREVLDYAGLAPDRIERLIRDGMADNLVAAAVSLAWSKMRQRSTICLVSDGIGPDEARALGFVPYAGLDEALSAALRRHGSDAGIAVLTHAPETLPILPEE